VTAWTATAGFSPPPAPSPLPSTPEAPEAAEAPHP